MIMDVKEELNKRIGALDEAGAKEVIDQMLAEAKASGDGGNLDELAKALLASSRKDLDDVQKTVNDLTVKEKMGSLADALNLSYIARVYFGKSRSWLYQRVNGYSVNGKPAKFTTEESATFCKALDDIKSQIAHFSIA